MADKAKTERLLIQLTKEQKKFLEKKAYKEGVSQAEIVRKAIEHSKEIQNESSQE